MSGFELDGSRMEGKHILRYAGGMKVSKIARYDAVVAVCCAGLSHIVFGNEVKPTQLTMVAPGHVSVISAGEGDRVPVFAGSEEVCGKLRVCVGPSGELVATALDDVQLDYLGTRVHVEKGGWVVSTPMGSSWHLAHWEKPFDFATPVHRGTNWTTRYVIQPGDTVMIATAGLSPWVGVVGPDGSVSPSGYSTSIAGVDLGMAQHLLSREAGRPARAILLAHANTDIIVVTGERSTTERKAYTPRLTVEDVAKCHKQKTKRVLLRRGNALIDVDRESLGRTRVFPCDIIVFLD